MSGDRLNRRLTGYLGEEEASKPQAERVGEAGQYGDEIGEDGRPVPDGVGDPDDQPAAESGDEPACVDCGSTHAVADPSEEIHPSLPSAPRCRRCLQEVA